MNHDPSFGLYPNPANNSITLQFDTSYDAGKMSIFSAHGVLIKQVEVSEQIIQFSVADLVEGIYFVDIVLDGYPQMRKSFVKNN